MWGVVEPFDLVLCTASVSFMSSKWVSCKKHVVLERGRSLNKWDLILPYLSHSGGGALMMGYSWFIAAVFCDALFHINASRHVSRRSFFFSKYALLKNFMLPSLWHVILHFLVGETCPLEALSFLCGVILEYMPPYWLWYCCLESFVPYHYSSSVQIS